MDNLNGTDKSNPTDLKTLSTGVVVKVTPVPDFLMQQAGANLTAPEVPYVLDDRYEDGRKIFNKEDPQYEKAVGKFNLALGMARIDIKLLWGCEVVEGYPENDEWLRKLKFQESLGAGDLSAYNLDEPFVCRFVFLKLIAIGNEVDEDGGNSDLRLLMRDLEVTEEGVAEATPTFRHDEKRDDDPESGTKKSK